MIQKIIIPFQNSTLVMIEEFFFALERLRKEGMKEGSSSAKKALTEWPDDIYSSCYFFSFLPFEEEIGRIQCFPSSPSWTATPPLYLRFSPKQVDSTIYETWLLSSSSKFHSVNSAVALWAALTDVKNTNTRRVLFEIKKTQRLFGQARRDD